MTAEQALPAEHQPVGEAPTIASTPGAGSGSGSPIDDPRALQILSTEHWSLLTARSLAYNEAFARAGMFLSFLSATLIVIGLMLGGFLSAVLSGGWAPTWDLGMFDQVIGFGQARRDSLPPGPYTVRAVLPSNLPGCTWASVTRPVNVRAGVVQPVQLAPKLCGAIEIKASGRRNEQPIEGTIWYTMQPEGGPEPPEAPLPASGITKVLPVGKYILRLRMNSCAPYFDELEILAGETIARTSIALIC